MSKSSKKVIAEASPRKKPKKPSPKKKSPKKKSPAKQKNDVLHKTKHLSTQPSTSSALSMPQESYIRQCLTDNVAVNRCVTMANDMPTAYGQPPTYCTPAMPRPQNPSLLYNNVHQLSMFNGGLLPLHRPPPPQRLPPPMQSFGPVFNAVRPVQQQLPTTGFTIAQPPPPTFRPMPPPPGSRILRSMASRPVAPPRHPNPRGRAAFVTALRFRNNDALNDSTLQNTASSPGRQRSAEEEKADIRLPIGMTEWLFVSNVTSLPVECLTKEHVRLAVHTLYSWQERYTTNPDHFPPILRLTQSILAGVLEVITPAEDVSSRKRTEAVVAFSLVTIISTLDNFSAAINRANQCNTMKHNLRNMGVADWLVQLRHQIAHKTTPSIDVMVSALHAFRAWVFNRYWSVTESNDHWWTGVDGKTELTEFVHPTASTSTTSIPAQFRVSDSVPASPSVSNAIAMMGMMDEYEVQMADALPKMEKGQKKLPKPMKKTVAAIVQAAKADPTHFVKILTDRLFVVRPVIGWGSPDDDAPNGSQLFAPLLRLLPQRFARLIFPALLSKIEYRLCDNPPLVFDPEHEHVQSYLRFIIRDVVKPMAALTESLALRLSAMAKSLCAVDSAIVPDTLIKCVLEVTPLPQMSMEERKAMLTMRGLDKLRATKKRKADVVTRVVQPPPPPRPIAATDSTSNVAPVQLEAPPPCKFSRMSVSDADIAIGVHPIDADVDPFARLLYGSYRQIVEDELMDDLDTTLLDESQASTSATMTTPTPRRRLSMAQRRRDSVQATQQPREYREIIVLD